MGSNLEVTDVFGAYLLGGRWTEKDLILYLIFPGIFWRSGKHQLGKGDYVINRAEEELKVAINMLLYKSKEQ